MQDAARMHAGLPLLSRPRWRWSWHRLSETRARAAQAPRSRCWERPCMVGRRRRRVSPPPPCWLQLHPLAAAAGARVLHFCACSGTFPRAACAGSAFPCHRKGALTCTGRPVNFRAQRTCNGRCNTAIECLRWTHCRKTCCNCIWRCALGVCWKSLPQLHEPD